MYYAALHTPAGPIWVAWREPDAPAVIGEDHHRDTDFLDFVATLRIDPPQPTAAVPQALARRLRRAARGDRDDRGPVDLFYLTPFRRRVLEKVREIPRGQVRSYGWVAREIGHPRAMRAVGTTLRNNPLGFLVPCHRVRRADAGTAVVMNATVATHTTADAGVTVATHTTAGTSAPAEAPVAAATPTVLRQRQDNGAASRDRRLQAEGVDLDLLTWLMRRGSSLCGDRNTRTYCLPSCSTWRNPGARPIYFHNAAEARAAGYRPCSRCKPSAMRFSL